MSRLLEFARVRAISDPTNERNVEAGLTPRGTKRADALGMIEDKFEELNALLNHIALIDMAGAFESYFRTRLGTAIGEVRKVVRERYRSNLPLHAHRENLIRDAEEFQGLAEIGRLIGERISAEVRESWETIRRDRNSFAHGTDLRSTPDITGERARQTLNEIIAAL